MSKQREEEINKMQADDDDHRDILEEDEETDSKLEIIRLRKQRDKKRKPIDRQAAFIEYKQEADGKVIEDQIISNRMELKDRKQKVKIYTE